MDVAECLVHAYSASGGIEQQVALCHVQFLGLGVIHVACTVARGTLEREFIHTVGQIRDLLMSVEVLSSGDHQVLLIGHGCTAPSFSVGACGVLDEVACVHWVAFASRFHLVQKVSQLQCGQAVLGLGELLIGALAVVEHALGAAEVNAREACLGLLDGYLQFGVGQRNLQVGVLRCVYTDGLVVHVERNVVRSGGHAPVAVAVVAVAGVCHARDELQVGHAAAVASFGVAGDVIGQDTEVAHAVAALIEGELTRVDAVALVHEA